MKNFSDYLEVVQEMEKGISHSTDDREMAKLVK